MFDNTYEILTALPEMTDEHRHHHQDLWLLWRQTNDGLPPLRMILVWDNLAGHRNQGIQHWLLDWCSCRI